LGQSQRRGAAAPLKILDLCTGTGCIALLLRHRLNEAKIHAEITAVDKSQAAVSLALHNKQACARARYDASNSSSVQKMTHLQRLHDTRRRNLSSSYARVYVERVDIFDDDAIDRLIYSNGPFDVIASNPPYVTAEEWKTLDKTVRNWEDSDALIGDTEDSQDGLAFYRRIALLIERTGILTPNPTSSKMPSLLVEVGHTQAKAVQDLFIATGHFSKTELIEDQWQKQRGVMAWSRSSRQ
jgi:release factor glutamine methyltransferase